jgi:hypothetical protein
VKLVSRREGNVTDIHRITYRIDKNM